MTLDTSRRRVLYLIGATGATGSVGHAAAGSHDDDDGSDRSDDQGDHGEDRDDDEDEDEDRDDRHDGELNEADVRFLQMMIPHHEQATEMAELVPGRTNRSELCALAEEVIEAQEAEIGTMEEWLETHGHDPHDHEMDHDEMDGMLTDEAMDELAAAEGDEFDRLFLSGMIHHHEGAIVMAEDVLAEGEDGDVRQLAEEVIEVQEAEIETMRKWCRDWF